MLEIRRSRLNTQQGKAKGFILQRAEKGKDNYTPITSLIPYFGRDDKDIFRYRFTDNSAKSGFKYEYRLEVVKSGIQTGIQIRILDFSSNLSKNKNNWIGIVNATR